MTLDQYLKQIAEDLNALERFTHEIAQHVAQIERSSDIHNKSLYYIDRKIRKIYAVMGEVYNEEEEESNERSD